MEEEWVRTPFDSQRNPDQGFEFENSETLFDHVPHIHMGASWAVGKTTGIDWILICFTKKWEPSVPRLESLSIIAERDAVVLKPVCA